MIYGPAPISLSAAQQALALKIDAVLPQTQCRQCHYPDCRRYAEAIAGGTAAINQCPPGDEAGVAKLAAVTGQPVLALNPAHGRPQPFAVAVIDEAVCIGCTLCIQACPVDAILGAAKRMHTVLADECSGCELCLAPCPVDCISMQPATAPLDAAPQWRRRHQAHLQRMQLLKDARARQLAATRKARSGVATPELASAATSPPAAAPDADAQRRERIAQAMAKAASRLGPR